ncbi:MAG: sigma-70 family RNA polymerase sigma factor [Acidobacteria bacterium]|nr:sigma-70 family RNA polymerase sigma factor [Acidobacteriota bacterium]
MSTRERGRRLKDVMRASAMRTADGDRHEEDWALSVRAQEGDRDAFGELVRRHQKLVFMVCRQYVGADDADEAAQETFLKAYTKLGTYDGRSKLSTWLVRIGINTCLDLLRKRARRGIRVDGDGGENPIMAVLPDDAADPERRAIQRQTVARLAYAEAALPAQQREVFRLRFYAEMELDEIAEALDVTVGTVKKQLHRAVHRVREELEAVR